MSRSWTLSSQRDEGYVIRLHEYSTWVGVAERLVPCAHFLDRLRVFGWLWRVPVGRPRWDDMDGDRFMENSVMSKLIDVESWVLDRLDRRWREVAAVPVDVETARSIDAEFVSIFEDDEESA